MSVVRMDWVASMAVVVAMASLVVGCEPEVDISPPKPKPPVQPAATAEELAALPLSKRILGTWTVDLADVPDSALNEDTRALRQKGLEDKVKLEYVFNESDFIMRKTGIGGASEHRFKYQIVQQIDDTLVLERDGEDGKTQRIFASMKDGKLQIGRGARAVVLQRK